MLIALLILAIVLIIIMIVAAVYGWRSAYKSSGDIELDDRLKCDNTCCPDIVPEIVAANTYEWVLRLIENK